MYQLSEIAAAVSGTLVGVSGIAVSGVAEPAAAGPDDLAVALTPAFAARLAEGRARAALLSEGTDWAALGLRAAILVPRGRLALARITALMDPGQGPASGVHPTALVEGVLGDGVSVGAFSIVGRGARIGAGCRIGSHVSIAPGAEIGDGGLIRDGVRIGPGVRIGARAVLQPNVVIGGDGFSFVSAAPSHAETARQTLGAAPLAAQPDLVWHRIHSLGGVEIGDDVEIGAGSTVDAGTLRATRIGTGSKLDNLVQIGHNVVIGDHCLVCAQAGIAGSSVIGDRVVVGGKAGVGDNLTIGSDVVLGGGTIVLSNVPAGRVMLGYPAMPMAGQIESYKALRRLPRLLARLRNAEIQVSKPGDSH